MQISTHWKGVWAAVAVFTLWGFTFLAAKYGQSVASPLVVLMYRFDLSALVMAIPLLLRRQKLHLKGKKVGLLLLLGLCEPVIYFLGEQYGLKLSNSVFSGVMIAVIPIVTLLLASVFLRERPTKLQWVFSACSIVGVIAISLLEGGSGQITLPGVLLLLLAVVSGSGYSIISRRISGEFSVYERSFVMQLMGAAAFTILSVCENLSDPGALIRPVTEPMFLFPVLYLALGASVVGYLLFNYAVSVTPVANVMVLCNLTTVLSVIAGMVLLQEPFSPLSLLALIVILVGIWGVQKFGPKEAPVLPEKS